jgi:hypothetical protein
MAGIAHLAANPSADEGGAPGAGAVVLGTLAAGAVVAALLGYVTAQWGKTPAGNSALVVPFAGGPAVLAAGWAALILALYHQERERQKLLAGSAAAGGAALLLGLAAVFLPVVAVTSAPGVAPAAAILWPAALPLLATLIGTGLAAWLGYPSGLQGWLGGIVVAVLVAAGALLVPGLGYALAPLLIPLPLLVPLLLGRPVLGTRAGGAGPRWGWFAAGALALPVILVAAFFVTSRA